MNGPRYEGAETVEGRLAAVVMELLTTVEQRNLREGQSHIVDYADLREHLRPYLQKEMIHARMEEIRELRDQSRNRLVAREGVLIRQLADLEAQIASRHP